MEQIDGSNPSLGEFSDSLSGKTCQHGEDVGSTPTQVLYGVLAQFGRALGARGRWFESNTPHPNAILV